MTYNELKEFDDMIIKECFRIIDSELLWDISFNKFRKKAEELNNGKNIFDRRTKGGKYLKEQKKRFINGEIILK